MTNQTRTVLIIDDLDTSFRYLEGRFEASNRWRVTRAKNSEQALQRLKGEANGIDAVILDPGLPPDVNSPLMVGLPLARKIRENHERMPILVISNLGIQEDTAGKFIAGLLPLGISAVFVRQAGDYDPVIMLELVVQGFFILSSGAADQLSVVAANRPDPLEEELWDVIRLLAQELSYEQIGKELAIDKTTAQDRRKRALDRLIELGELDMDDEVDGKAATSRLKQWYRENNLRFRRDNAGYVYRARHRKAGGHSL